LNFPAGAALCHKLVVCGKDGLNSRHRMGRLRENAVVLFDCDFVDVRDNDRNGYDRLAAKFEWKACPVALDNSYKKQDIVNHLFFLTKNLSH